MKTLTEVITKCIKKSINQVMKNQAYDKYHDTFNFTITDRMINSCCAGYVAYNDQPYMYI